MLNSITQIDSKGLFGRQRAGSYLRKAKRSFGNPCVNRYYGSYDASPVLQRLLELPLSLLLVILRTTLFLRLTFRPLA